MIKPLAGQSTQTNSSITAQTPKKQNLPNTNIQPAASSAEENSRPRSTSLKNLLRENDKKKEHSATQIQESNSDFSQDDLQKYWTEYANTLDIKKIHLKNTLLNCKPKLEKDFSFEVGVFNPAQKDEIADNISSIFNFLISKLNNSHIKMTIRILEQDKKEMIYTSIEKFNYLISKNQNLEKLVNIFNLAPE